ncbi:MAG TPA: DUF3198 domain-containing protein [Thermoplasmata archaeon]|jgi:hypothetical protein|nr:DUF3198 domain-containing protein [Thermoplasmata archaeon]
MAASPEKPGFSSRLRHGFRANRAWVAAAVLGIGILLSVLALGSFTPLASSFPFSAINTLTVTPSANYNLVFVVLGPIIAIAGAYLFGSYVIARRKFEHLMVTKSKAEFLRSIPELEEILWELTPADELRYERKKVELKIRR